MRKIEKKDNTSSFIRITDKGAVSAVIGTVNTLIHIASILRTNRVEQVDDLVEVLKNQLKKYLRWFERNPDGTLFQNLNPKQLAIIKRDAKNVLKWRIIPSEKEQKKREKYLKEFESLQKEEEERFKKRILIMLDTSFLLSYLSNKDINHFSANTVISYLKTQRKFFDFYFSNFVLLELIAKLKQQLSFKMLRGKFRRLLDEISDNHILVSEQRLSIFDIFDRYQKFSKKKLSSSLRSNDFIIATDGILGASIIITCDKKMYEGIKKTYQDVFLITDAPESYLKFIKSFEKQKTKQISPTETPK